MSTRFCKYLLLQLLFVSFIGCNQDKPPVLHQSEKFKSGISIGLLPYDGFDTSLLTFIKNETETFYHCDVILLKSCTLPHFAWYAPRSRYKADSLLHHQLGFKNAVSTVAGLTDKDISTTNGSHPDWGVFGLGFCPGKACVISTYRLQKASATRAQLKERLIKVVLHELGHNFGLPHCTTSPECLMADAKGTMTQVDREQKKFCTSCRNAISL